MSTVENKNDKMRVTVQTAANHSNIKKRIL